MSTPVAMPNSETLRYYEYLTRIEQQEFEKELMDIGFRRIFFSPDEAAQIISCCEQRLIKEKKRDEGFTVDEIRGGILRDHLTTDDYNAPLKLRARTDERYKSVEAAYLTRHNKVLEELSDEEKQQLAKEMSELGDDVYQFYLPEDRRAEISRTKATEKRIQSEISKLIRDDWGPQPALPETEAKELFLQGLRRIRISALLNEAAAKYAKEGWARIAVAIAGSDTALFHDIMESLFGDPEELEPADLDEPETKRQRMEAETAEEEAQEAQGQPSTSGTSEAGVHVVYPTRVPIPTEFGVGDELYELTPIGQRQEDGTHKTVYWYMCVICRVSKQNKDTTCTHIRKDHLRVKVGCPMCKKRPLDGTDAIQNHIQTMHADRINKDGTLIGVGQDVAQETADALVAAIAEEEQRRKESKKEAKGSGLGKRSRPQ